MLKYLDVIEDQIHSEKCVIMLGPNAVKTTEGKLLQEHLWDQIKANQDVEIKLDFDSDSFLKLPKYHQRVAYHTQLKKVYTNQQKPDLMHQQLAQIPCHLFISTTPDLRFRQAFDDQKFNYQFQFYNKKESAPTPITPPKTSFPLLYNLFGSIQDRDSMIFTQGDLFDFLFSILGDNKLPGELMQTVKQADYFLFLGFDFDKWYLRLILRLFDLHQESSTALASGFSDRTKEPIQRFYKDNFDFVFVNDGMEEYVDALYKNFDNRGLLRNKIEKSSTNPLIKTIRKLLQEDELTEALEILEDYGETQSNQNLSDTATQLMGRLRSLKKSERNGTIARNEAQKERNQIRKAVLDAASDN